MTDWTEGFQESLEEKIRRGESLSLGECSAALAEIRRLLGGAVGVDNALSLTVSSQAQEPRKLRLEHDKAYILGEHAMREKVANLLDDWGLGRRANEIRALKISGVNRVTADICYYGRAENIKSMGPFDSELEAWEHLCGLNGLPVAGATVWPEKRK